MLRNFGEKMFLYTTISLTDYGGNATRMALDPTTRNVFYISASDASPFYNISVVSPAGDYVTLLSGYENLRAIAIHPERGWVIMLFYYILFIIIIIIIIVLIFWVRVSPLKDFFSNCFNDFTSFWLPLLFYSLCKLRVYPLEKNICVNIKYIITISILLTASSVNGTRNKQTGLLFTAHNDVRFWTVLVTFIKIYLLDKNHISNGKGRFVTLLLLTADCIFYFIINK